MHDVIYGHNKNIPMLSVIDLNQDKRINTSFGTMPASIMTSIFIAICQIQKKCNQTYAQYPLKRPMTDFLNTLLI